MPSRAADFETDYAKSLIKRRRLAPEVPPLAVPDWPWAYRVRTLGSFQLLRNEEPMQAAGKAQRKPIELLKVVIAHGAERVPEEFITEALWPRIEGDSAHRSFTSALHRLRKLLGEDRAVLLHEGRVTLDRRYFWIDTWVFEELVAKVEEAFRPGRVAPDSARMEGIAKQLLDLYRGPFLGTEPEASWQLDRRARLRSRFARATNAFVRRWEQCGDLARASDVRQKAFEIEPLALPRTL